MNFIRRVIFRVLTVEAYLQVVSKLFFIFYFTGLLKGRSSFDCHYLVKKLVKKGDYVIDLGANLGYYSLIFSKRVGLGGKVFSIEPVELFRNVLLKNTRKQKNIEIIPYAVGATDNETIQMGVPGTAEYFSHGRTHVLASGENCSMVFDAVMMRPGTIFRNLEKLDYLKCDIEGFENIAIPLFKNILLQFKPVLQIEIAPKNRAELLTFLKSLEYSAFEAKGDKLYRVDGTAQVQGDFIFIDNSKLNRYAGFSG